MSHNNFKESDSQIGKTNADGGDMHLSNAREEIGRSIGSDFVGTMRQDTSNGLIPSGNVEKSGSINFGPGDGHNHNGTNSSDQKTDLASNDGHGHQAGSSDNQAGSHSAGDGHNHKGSIGQQNNNQPGDGHDHQGASADSQSGNHSAGDGHNHNGNLGGPQSGNHSVGDGDNHNGIQPADAQAGNHTLSDGHNHNGSTNAKSNLVNGDTAALNEQTRMSQDAARLGLGARDIALMQQMEGSVPHSSPRELAERLKAARDRGGILDLSRRADS